MTFDPAPVTPAAPLPAPPAAPARRRSSRVLNLALAGAAVLAIGGVAFAIGRATAPAPAAVGFAPGGVIARPGGSFDPGNGPGARFAFGGGLTVDGTVTAVDADSVTVKTANGNEMTFDTDGSTAYRQASEASASEVTVGDDVSVKVSNDGPISAPLASGETPRLSASDVAVTR
jgi:Domain of unknown function (DUF5666)